jgi:hypothetical protein
VRKITGFLEKEKRGEEDSYFEEKKGERWERIHN